MNQLEFDLEIRRLLHIDKINEINMDKKIKSLQKSTDKIVKQEKSLLKTDKKNDAKMAKCKMKMKKK